MEKASKEHVKELHTIARHDYIAWRSAGKPRFGEICLSMNQSRLRFKSALKFCKHNENQMKADALARFKTNNDMNEFWKYVKKNTNSNVSLPTNVDRSVGDTEIAEMWKCHNTSLLYSVQNEEFKKSVMLDINQQHETSITITHFNILDALKSRPIIITHRHSLTHSAYPGPGPGRPGQDGFKSPFQVFPAN